jgi:thiamine-phosphate pyrophosphorylase
LLKIDPRLYVITDGTLGGHEDITSAALAGGASVVQLRDKQASSRQLHEIALRLRGLLAEANIPLIVNDRVDIVLGADAQGVHVGPDDLPIAVARLILGSARVVGASAGTIAEAVDAERAGADYLGVGPVFPTGTKPDARAPIGLEGLRRIASSVTIPVVGIGGISADNAGDVIEAGAAGVAVISAVAGAEDRVRAVQAIRRAVDVALAK